MRTKQCDAQGCDQTARFSDHCGAWVCYCGAHVGLDRCYCGWARNGGDGRVQLEEDGETIDED